jgi:hypothetical protein
MMRVKAARMERMMNILVTMMEIKIIPRREPAKEIESTKEL